MDTDTNSTSESSHLDRLVDEARALLEATAGVAGETVGAARKRLAAAIESSKRAAHQVADKAVAGAKATDTLVREHPWQAVGIAVGVGALIGFLCSHRCCRRD
jgi:ElaB/YqjD/DUF883 family membrane-anchored ribosome-binding protein